jgi:thiol-disulfide isomerase/thioredoxin
MKQEHFDYKKYIFAFIVTTALFLTAFSLSNFFGNKKVKELQSIENNISLDILSNETQYDLLGEVSCKNVDDSILSSEINTLAEKLTYAESQQGTNSDQVAHLKKYYSLLQIKDYLLSKRLAEKCGKKSVFVIYLYGKESECPNCRNQASVLDYLRKTYPDLRIYAFDYNLDLSAIQTLLSIYKIKGQLPALVLDGEVYYGYKTKEEIIAVLPKTLQTNEEIEAEKQAALQASTTKSR